MKNSLDLLPLEKIDLRDVFVDLDKFNVINMSSYKPKDILHISPYKYYTALNYAKKYLEKGYGIYCDDTVYYLNNLNSEYFHKSKIEKLKRYINKTLINRKNKHYAFKEYLLEARFFVLVENYIRLYNHNLVTIEWVRKKLEDRVSNVDVVIEKDFLGSI